MLFRSGFGAGSDLTWSALATVNYVFSDHLSGSVGYKVLDVDYDHGGHVYDTRLSGPVLGMTYRFRSARVSRGVLTDWWSTCLDLHACSLPWPQLRHC